MDYVDMPIHRFKVSEVLVSDISGDQLRILRKMKSEAWCHSDHVMTVSNRLFAGVIGRMNDQQPTVSAEPLIHAANHGSIQRCDSIRLVPTICCEQHQTCPVCVAEDGMEVHTFRASAVYHHLEIDQNVDGYGSFTRHCQL